MEGPTLIPLTANGWRLYMDLSGEGIFYAESSNTMATFGSKTAIVAPYVPEHGTVILKPFGDNEIPVPPTTNIHFTCARGGTR